MHAWSLCRRSRPRPLADAASISDELRQGTSTTVKPAARIPARSRAGSSPSEGSPVPEALGGLYSTPRKRNGRVPRAKVFPRAVTLIAVLSTPVVKTLRSREQPEASTVRGPLRGLRGLYHRSLLLDRLDSRPT